jgi:hypothetical protein
MSGDNVVIEDEQLFRLVPVASGSFGKGKLGSGSRFAACKTSQMSKMNPRTKATYTAEEADAICASIGRRAYGKERFQKLSAKGKTSSAISSLSDEAPGELASQFQFVDEADDDGQKYWRYLLAASSDGAKAKGDKGSIFEYTGNSHKAGASSFIGTPLVLNHDGDLPGGLIFDSWAEENGDLKQVVHVYSEEYKNMLDKGYRLSIRTIPTDIQGTKIEKYEALHTSILFPGDIPGDESAGVIGQLESKVGEEKGETILTEKTFTQAELDAIMSSKVAEIEKVAQAKYEEKMKLTTLKSSISTAFGTKDETLDVIAGGGIAALEAFKSSIADVTEKAKQTVISQKSVVEDGKKEEVKTVKSTITNTAEDHPGMSEIELTPEEIAESDAVLKRVGIHKRG